MIAVRYATLAGVLALACSVTTYAGQTTDGSPATRLTPDEQEVFLLEAPIARGSVRRLGTGVTVSRRATLTDGATTYDAHIQTVDIAMPIFEAGRHSEIDFKDSYKFNIAGYRLARLIGLDNVPVSVERTFERQPAAFTWWVDDVRMDEHGRVEKGVYGPDALRFTQQTQIMYVFDELIQNRDRNRGNVLWTSDWTLWMIDHTRAFRTGHELLRPERLQRIDRTLLDNLRRLTREALGDVMGRILTSREMDAVMARRDLIVAHYDARIAERGEGAVLFTLRSAAESVAPAAPVH
jgi:hypothetical protein